MDGLLLVNKEENYTSRDVVNVISKIFNTSKVGHAGTLDPIAEGVLVIAVGKGLKLIDFLSCYKKEYIATVSMGLLTDTLDVTGNKIMEFNGFSIDKDTLSDKLKEFVGKSIQTVPLYSAVKVNGKRLYEYARKGENIELPKREIEIYDIELLDFNDKEFKFRVEVSKGTYIRSLIKDIGDKLKIPCTMKNLVRTKQGNFKIEDSYTLNEIKNGNYKIIPLIDCIDNFFKVEVDDYIAKKISNGRILENRYKEDKIAFINNNQLLALYKPYEKDQTLIKPIKVFK